MAQKTQTCGKTTVTYDARCTYTCSCLPAAGCTWTVSCPGDLVTTGTGFTTTPPRTPHVTVAGDLSVCAGMLAKIWRRRVIVPDELRNKRLRTQTLEGTPEDIAQALGLRLGPRR